MELVVIMCSIDFLHNLTSSIFNRIWLAVQKHLSIVYLCCSKFLSCSQGSFPWDNFLGRQCCFKVIFSSMVFKRKPL